MRRPQYLRWPCYPPAAGASTSAGTSAQAAQVTREIESLPGSAFDAVGTGGAAGLSAIDGQPALTADGKPEVLYLGGEFCPYCAAERWALATALSRFGSFGGLGLIRSSAADVYAGTPTLDFARSSYTSKYLTFTPVEWFGEAEDASSPFGHAVLQQPTAAESALFQRFGTGSIPFVDFGNAYQLPSAQYLPSDLSNMTWEQVAAATHDPSSTVARDIDGPADIITAALCELTGGQPGSVCTSAGATAAAGSLGSS